MLDPRTSCRSLLLLALGLLPACMDSGGPDGARAGRTGEGSGPIVIGAPWPWDARSSIRYADGMQLALDEINAAGGVQGRPLALLRVDDHEDIDRGRLVAQELSRNPEVVAVIGHLQSYVTVPAAAIYDLSGLVHLAPTATTVELTRRGYRRVFRTTFSDADVGRDMAEYALRQGYRRIVIYYSRDEYGRGLANAFEERATRGDAGIIDRRSYDPSTPANPLAAAEAANAWMDLAPDAVFIAGDGESAALLARELDRSGSAAPLLGGDALGIPAFLSLGGEAVEGTVIASRFNPDTPTPEVERFTDAFRERFGADPDVGAALGYDAVRVLAHAMGVAGSAAPERVAAALHGLRGWTGVTGVFSFGEAGDLREVPIRKVVVRGGAFRHLDEPPAPESGGP